MAGNFDVELPKFINDPIIESMRTIIFSYNPREIELDEIPPVFKEIVTEVTSKSERTILDLEEIINSSIKKLKVKELLKVEQEAYRNLMLNYVKESFQILSKESLRLIDEIRSEYFPVKCLLAWADAFNHSSKILQQIYKRLTGPLFWSKIGTARSPKDITRKMRPIKETLLVICLVMIRIYEMASRLLSVETTDSEINEQLLLLSEEITQLSETAIKWNFIPEITEAEEEKIFLEAIKVITSQ
nr:hypothetical protein [Candidatus Freyarchaeota archaeon]